MGKSRCWKSLTPTAAEEAAAAADPDGPSTSGRIQEPHGPQRYLCYFIYRYLDFRIPEVTALASLAGCPPEDIQWEEPHGGNHLSPFWYVTFPSPHVAFTVAKYAVLTRVSCARCSSSRRCGTGRVHCPEHLHLRCMGVAAHGECGCQTNSQQLSHL
jgi:hypothetical protein